MGTASALAIPAPTKKPPFRATRPSELTTSPVCRSPISPSAPKFPSNFRHLNAAITQLSRPAPANALASGQRRFNLKNEWRGGVTSVLVTPRDLLIRALAQIPLSGRPSIRYYGCFAPNAADR
ncbi:MAG: hypothetical protein EXR77_20400, partial [Myxococcales bacterium]|nr:hypothetical protein [Myxococcales bacterium]